MIAMGGSEEYTPLQSHRGHQYHVENLPLYHHPFHCSPDTPRSVKVNENVWDYDEERQTFRKVTRPSK